MAAASLSLNVYQVLQNELLSREGTRSTLGMGFRLSILETKVNNAEAIARNGRVWKLHHSISPIKGLTPQARRAAKAEERRLMGVGIGKKDRERDPTKDPGKLVRDLEVWEVAEGFPRTVGEFKGLQFEPERIRDLMEFYDVPAYWNDERLIEIHPDDRCREICANIETCMEELAMTFGLNWHRIGGLVVSEGVGGMESGSGSRPPSQQQQQQQQYYGPVRRDTMYGV